jgi:hypothetical protein
MAQWDFYADVRHFGSHKSGFFGFLLLVGQREPVTLWKRAPGE